MPPSIYTIEILETWVKKVKVLANTTSEALAKAKADFIDENNGREPPYLAGDPAATPRDIDIKLEFPTGNPVDPGKAP